MDELWRNAITLAPGKQIRLVGQKTYEIVGQCGNGGSSQVYEVRTTVRPLVSYAMKLFLPIYWWTNGRFGYQGDQDQSLKELSHHLSNEAECLAKVDHSGVARLIEIGEYRPIKAELHPDLARVRRIGVLVMELVEGVDVVTHLESRHPTKAEVVSIFRKLCETLAYLHTAKKFIHADLRPENILIRQDRAEPVLIDFALCQRFDFPAVDPDESVKLEGDWDLFPAKTLPTPHDLKQLKETSGTRRQIQSLCFPGLDLYQVGKLLQRLRVHIDHLFAPDELEYLNLLEQALVAWEVVSKLDAATVEGQFAKLDPSHLYFMGTEELTPPSSARRTMQIPGRVVAIPPIIGRVLNTRSFQRLRSISQLSFVSVLYPGAVHNRYLHSLRTYAYCAELLKSLAHSPHFRFFFTPLLARQALVISLLHDINHFPLLHVFQEIAEEDMRGVDLVSLFCDGQATNDSPSIYDLLEEVQVSRGHFKDMLFSDHHKIVSKGYLPGTQIIKSIIDSGADIDKMAYLEDDSLFTGVTYGRGLDLARLLASATVVQVPSGNNGWHLAYRESGLPAIESLVMARLWMFRTVYWHRRHRAIMSMLMYDLRRLQLDVMTFARETMWLPGEGVLEHIDARHKDRFDRSGSLTASILKDPTTIYGRLVSVQGGSPGPRDSELYTKIHAMSAQQIAKFQENLCSVLQDRIGETGFPLHDGDLLVDVPGRRLDRPGVIYLQMASGEARDIEAMEGSSIPGVLKAFEGLAKRIRIFAHPRVLRKLTEQGVANDRAQIVTLLGKAIPKSLTGQVR